MEVTKRCRPRLFGFVLAAKSRLGTNQTRSNVPASVSTATKQHVDVAARPEAASADAGDEPAPLRARAGVQRPALDLYGERTGLLTAVEHEVHALVVHEPRGNVELELAGEDARGRNEVLDRLALAGRVAVLCHSLGR
jgi:hypothetical protein